MCMYVYAYMYIYIDMYVHPGRGVQVMMVSGYS